MVRYFLFLVLPSAIFATDIVGNWKIVSPKTNKVITQVEIYRQKRIYYGRIKQHIDVNQPDARCSKCPGDFKDKPIQGLRVLWGLKKGSREYYGGQILDCYNGKTYGVKVWLEDKDKLKIRGYFGPMLKNNIWQRIK